MMRMPSSDSTAAMTMLPQLFRLSLKSVAALGMFLGCAPLHAETSPGSALEFDGLDDVVQIADAPEFHSLPLTLTAWVRTSQNTSDYVGIVSKTAEGSDQGYALGLHAGRIEAWYFAGAGRRVWIGEAGSAGPFVADGVWHHVAVVFTPTTGSLYVDGAFNVIRGWTGQSGPISLSSTIPVQIGSYVGPSKHFFKGRVDEVTIWNRALSLSECSHLRHRHLLGSATGLDGLLAYYPLDEAAGPTATDATAAGHDGTYLGGDGPVPWPSTAPVVLDPVAQTALSLNGATSYARVAHDTAFNAYPLTVTAWIRTTDTSARVQGIVCKYLESSFNGYAMFVYNGRLRAWFLRDRVNYVWDAGVGGSDGLGLNGGLVADGAWHHVAFVVDAAGGKLYVDGVNTASLGWSATTLTKGPPNGDQDLLIGLYWQTPPYLPFKGLIDEVAVFNQALSVTQLISRKNRPLSGGETGLIGYWKMDDGIADVAATTAVDSSGNGRSAQIAGTPVWAGSTASIGDGLVHVSVDYTPSYGRLAAVATSTTGKDAFTLNVEADAWRFYDYGYSPGSPPPPATLNLQGDSQLRDASVGTLVDLDLSLNHWQFSFGLGADFVQSQISAAGFAKKTLVARLKPLTQLDSVDGYYTFGTSFEYGINVAPDTSVPLFELPITQVFHLNGKLFFSDLETRFSDFVNTPPRGGPLSGGVYSAVAVATDNGTVLLNPSYHYGNDTPILSIVYANGDCLAFGSTVTTKGPVPDEDKIANIFFQRDTVTLGDGGATGNVRLELPPGFTIGPTVDERLTYSLMPPMTVPLGPDLKPVGPVFTYPGPLYGVSDSFPLWIHAPQFDWEVLSGRIVLTGADGVQSVRQLEDELLQQALDANTVRNAEAGEHKSNDGYFAFATLAGPAVTVTASADGSARLNLDLNVDPGSFRPHFPLFRGGTPLAWTDRGTIIIRESAMDSGLSQLQGVQSVEVPYQQSCTNENCAASALLPPTFLSFTPAGNTLSFTPDGGLAGEGTVPPQAIAWGYISPGRYAHQAEGFADAGFLMAGQSLRADQTALASGDRPGVLLFTGVGKPGNVTYAERPYDSSYFVGDANYAGLNFRVGSDGAKQGESFLGGVRVGPYPLRGRSKYYCRFGGVNGIHEAQALPNDKLRFYGYDISLEGLLLSYLDGQNLESRTDGSVSLPNPAGFDQAFKKIKFLCRGDLDSAEIPPNSPEHSLVYWPAKVTAQTLVFRGNPSAPCGTTDRLLVFGADLKVVNIPDTLHGLLGFLTNGHLSTVAANRGTGIDSRFRPPAMITYRGPADSTYRLSVTGQGYFNDPLPGANVNQRSGFINVVGRTDLPFFEDMWSHLHLKNDGPAGVDVMGGWMEGGKSTLTTDKLDPAHLGFTGPDLDSYRNGNGFRPHARRNWMGIVDFDYALKWSPVFGTFTSAEESSKKLLVLEVKNRVNRMTPTLADLDFGIDAGIPKISIAKFAHDAIEGLTGAETALGSALGGAANTQLTRGLSSLNRIMGDETTPLFENALRSGLNTPLEAVYNALNTSYAVNGANPAKFVADAKAAVTLQLNAGTIRNALLGQGGVDQALSVVKQVQNALGDADQALGVVEDLLIPAGRDQRFKNVIQALVGSEAPGLIGQLGAGLANAAFSKLLQDVQPSLDALAAEVHTVRSRIADVSAKVGLGGFPEVNAVLGAEIQKAVDALAVEVSALISSADLADGRYFAEHSKQQVIEDLRRRLVNTVIGSGVAKVYQTALRERIYDLQARMRVALDGTFQTLNQLGTEALSSVLAEADKAFADFAGSNLSKVMAAAKVEGHAHIIGDSIKELTLDADLRLKIPDDFGFHGFLRIRELNSDNTPVGCLKGYDKATEVILGAKDVSLSWLSPNLRANLDGKFIFKLQNGGFEPIGMGGGLGVSGKMQFEVFELNELAAAVAFGQEENYLAGRVRAKVNRYEFATGFFFGRTCFIDPLIVADKDVAKTLPTRPENFPFTGAYLYGEVWVPLNEALGIPSSCAFNIRGGQGVGAFAFVDGAGHLTIGGKYLYGISGELLCVLGVQGEVSATGGITIVGGEPTLLLRGVGKLTAELGYCPFCLDWSTQIGMTIRAKSITFLKGAIGAISNPGLLYESLGEAEYEFDY